MKLRRVPLPFEVEHVCLGDPILLVKAGAPGELLRLSPDGAVSRACALPGDELVHGLFGCDGKNALVARAAPHARAVLSLVPLDGGPPRDVFDPESVTEEGERDRVLRWAAFVGDAIACVLDGRRDRRVYLVERGGVVEIGASRSNDVPLPVVVGRELAWVEESADEETSVDDSGRRTTQLSNEAIQLVRRGTGGARARYVVLPSALHAIAADGDDIWAVTKRDSWDDVEMRLLRVRGETCEDASPALDLLYVQALAVVAGDAALVTPNNDDGPPAIHRLVDGEPSLMHEVEAPIGIITAFQRVGDEVRWLETSQAYVFDPPPAGTPEGSFVGFLTSDEG